MDFAVGENIEAVDEFGVWANARVVEKRDASVVVTFPPWKSEWDREIIDASEARKATEKQVLVPRRFAFAKNPNLKKMVAGDEVYVAGEAVKVHWSDPIRKLVTVKLPNDTMRTVNVWEVETKREDADQQATRKRKRKDKPSQPPLQPDPQPQPQPQQPAVTESDLSDLEFCFYVDPSGTVIRIGSFYALKFSGNSIFVCTSISRVAHQFTFKFLLCSLVNDKVDSLLPDVACHVGNPKLILCRSNVSCTSKVRSHVDKIICEGWERVLSCQGRNIGNVPYLLDLRKSCLASQMRQGVWSGISRSATRPSQPIHLGVFDPVLDTQIFGLSSKDQFQLIYKGRDVGKLDSLLGTQWDVKILEPGNPQSHFKYVCQARLFVHKPSMSLRFNLPTRSQMFHLLTLTGAHVYISCKGHVSN